MLLLLRSFIFTVAMEAVGILEGIKYKETAQNYHLVVESQ